LHFLQLSADFIVFRLFEVFKEQLKDPFFTGSEHVRVRTVVGFIERHPFVEHGSRYAIVRRVNLFEKDFKRVAVVRSLIHIASIPLFKTRGYKILTSDFFKLYEAFYEKGKVKWIEYYHADGSLLYREVGSQCDKSNDSAASIEDLAARLTGPIQDRRGVWAWFDADGAMIYSSEMERDLREEAEKTKVCKSCGKFVPTETAVFRFGDYKCYQEFGEPISIFSMSPAYFCSVQCKMLHEEDKCLSNGYRYKRP